LILGLRSVISGWNRVSRHESPSLSSKGDATVQTSEKGDSPATPAVLKVPFRAPDNLSDGPGFLLSARDVIPPPRVTFLPFLSSLLRNVPPPEGTQS
jgi:hypothetical protein